MTTTHELSSYRDLETVYRRAVELGRVRIGLERVSLFLYDAAAERQHHPRLAPRLRAEKMGGMRRFSRTDRPTRAESEWCWDNSITPVSRHGQLSIDGTKIVDEHGAITQLKGVSTQWLNWEQS